MLTLPYGFHTGVCVPSAVFRLQSAMETVVIGIDFSDFYFPTTSPNFRIRLDDFVNAWNAYQNSQVILRRFGMIGVTGDGRLIMQLFSGITLGSHQLINGEDGGFAWWHEMGFDPVFEIPHSHWMEASRLPGNTDKIEIIGRGDTLNDADNICIK